MREISTADRNINPKSTFRFTESATLAQSMVEQKIITGTPAFGKYFSRKSLPRFVRAPGVRSAMPVEGRRLVR